MSLVRKSLGMWLMVDAARTAKKEGKEYLYLGTVYADKALYKTNFDNIEYWSGEAWIADKKKLRARSRRDKERKVECSDEWKEGVRN